MLRTMIEVYVRVLPVTVAGFVAKYLWCDSENEAKDSRFGLDLRAESRNKKCIDGVVRRKVVMTRLGSGGHACTYNAGEHLR